MSKKCIFSPSLICLDMCNLQAQVEELENNKIEMLHVDIIDGHFSPSMPLGLETVRQLRSKTALEFDVHLMVKDQRYFIDELLDIGIQQIVFHIEEEPHIDQLLNYIKSKGVRAGVALKPATSLATLDYVLEKCDIVLLMLINPGYASSNSESQICYASQKIIELKQRINEKKLNTMIEIDGRVSFDNIQAYATDYVDIFVTGSTCIKKKQLSDSIQKLEILRKQILNI